MKRLPIGLTLAMLVSLAILCTLGGWQLQRLAWKTRILAQIEARLVEAGSDKSKILSANIWLTDMATFAEMNAVWDAWVVKGHTPARATVKADLATPDYKVEIMVTAAR